MKRPIASIVPGALLLALASVGPAFAQGSDEELQAEIAALKKGQQEIQKELREIKKLLQSKPAAAAPAGPDVQGKIFELGANPVKGASNARLALLEFTDYQ